MTRYASSTVDHIRALTRLEIVLYGLAASISVLFLWLLTIERHGLYFSNQNTYFPAGLYRSGREFLEHDWFAQTRPPHLAFTYLVTALDRVHFLAPGVAVLEVLLEALLLLAIWLIAGGLYRTFNRSVARESRLALTSITFCLLVLGMQHRFILYDLFNRWHGDDVFELGLLWERIFSLSGIATQYIWGSFLQPSEFGILLLLAVGVMLHERWRMGALLAGMAVVMHAGYLPHAALLLIVAAGWLVYAKQRRAATQSLVIFGATVLPAVVYALTFAFQPESAESYHILANIRTPHHSVPPEWWSNVAVGQLAVIAAASLLLLWKRPGFLSWLMVAGLAYTVLGILLLWFVIDSDALAFSHPWRGSAYLVPLSLFILVAFVVRGALLLIQRLGGRSSAIEWLAVVIGMATLVATGVEALNAESRNDSNSRTEAAAITRRQTSPDDVILVPELWDKFRLEAERAIYVDYKSHPYLASEVLEWWRRIQVSRRFYSASESERGMICARERIDYYIVSSDTKTATHRQVAATDDYQLVACPRSGVSRSTAAD